MLIAQTRIQFTIDIDACDNLKIDVRNEGKEDFTELFVPFASYNRSWQSVQLNLNAHDSDLAKIKLYEYCSEVRNAIEVNL